MGWPVPGGEHYTSSPNSRQERVTMPDLRKGWKIDGNFYDFKEPISREDAKAQSEKVKKMILLWDDCEVCEGSGSKDGRNCPKCFPPPPSLQRDE